MNIHKGILKQLDDSAKISGYTGNEIIIRLVRRAMSEYQRCRANGLNSHTHSR